MPGAARPSLEPAHASRAMRVLGAFDRPRLGVTALVTVAMSLSPIIDTELWGFYTPMELLAAWLEHLAELGVIAVALLATYNLLDQALPEALPGRLMLLCVSMLAASGALTWLLYGYYAHGFRFLPPVARIVADSLRWGVPAAALVVIADVHRRALLADSAATAAERARAQAAPGDTEQQLALLQAQIEPHFLFNTLANVRRLYRTRPEAGAEAIDGLMRYLEAALPKLRTRTGTLGEELGAVQAYLELLRVRMGDRLRFHIDADATLRGAEFPPMLLMTLVENAITHGLEPVGGGVVRVLARRRRHLLEVSVSDDGAGFGAAGTSGTGVGLVNVQRQLHAHYPGVGRLTLRTLDPRGALVRIEIPLRIASGPHASPTVPRCTAPIGDRMRAADPMAPAP